MPKRSFGENLRRLINDPIGELKRSAGTADNKPEPAVPDTVRGEVPPAPEVPAARGAAPQEVEGWADYNGPEDQPWAGYPTVRERAGEVDNRPEHVKNVERQELWKQDQARQAEEAIAQSREDRRLEEDLRAANDRVRAQSPRRIAARIAKSKTWDEQQAEQAARAQEQAAHAEQRRLDQLRDSLRQLQGELAQAQARLERLQVDERNRTTTDTRDYQHEIYNQRLAVQLAEKKVARAQQVLEEAA